MSLEKLAEIYDRIDNFEKLSISLDGKISRTEDEKATEEAIQHLMKYELTKITNYLENLRKKVAQLELDYSRSTEVYQNSLKLYHEFVRSQRSITMLREFEESSKHMAQQNPHRKMFSSQDDRDDLRY